MIMFNSRIAGGPRKYFYPDKTHRALKTLGVSHTFINNVPGAKVDIDYGIFFIGLDNSSVSSDNGWSINSEGRLAIYKDGEQILSFCQTRLGKGKGRIFLEKVTEQKNFVPNTEHSFIRGTSFDQTFMVVIKYKRGVAKEEVNPFKEWNMKHDRLAKEELRKFSLPGITPEGVSSLATETPVPDEVVIEAIEDQAVQDEVVEEIQEIELEEEEIEKAITSKASVEAKSIVSASVATEQELEKKMGKAIKKLSKLNEKRRPRYFQTWQGTKKETGTGVMNSKEEATVDTLDNLFTRSPTSKDSRGLVQERVRKHGANLEAMREKLEGTSVERLALYRRRFPMPSELYKAYEKVNKTHYPSVGIRYVYGDLSYITDFFSGYLENLGADREKDSYYFDKLSENIKNKFHFRIAGRHFPFRYTKYIMSVYQEFLREKDADLDQAQTYLEEVMGEFAPPEDWDSYDISDVVRESPKKLIIEGMKVGSSEPLSDRIIGAIKWSLKILNRYGVTGFYGSFYFEVIPKVRASFNGGRIKIRPDEEIKVVIHEMFHSLEYAYRPIVDLVRGFLLSRVDPGKMTSCVYGEYAITDEFHSDYAGKMYEDQATELVTMGLQEFHSSASATQLASRDYAHFLFAMSIIDGSIMDRV